MRAKRRPLTVNGLSYTVAVLPDGTLQALDGLDRPVAHAWTRGGLVAQIRAAA